VYRYLSTCGSPNRKCVQLRRWRGGVTNHPMVHGRFSDNADCRIRDPFPENDVLVANVRLHLLFSVNVEDSECLCL
jgi:hypothetical protein